MNLSWLSIIRLGLVQMSLGAIVVLMTATLNRLMVVELALPAVLPGILVGLHYGVQITRPNWGFHSDKGGRRTPWIIGGMGILGAGGVLAAMSIPILDNNFALGMLTSLIAYILIGIGVGASGTSLLALLATSTAPRRRAAAATITWLMMIAGIAITAGTTGMMLDPYSHALLIKIVTIISAGAVTLTVLAMWKVESKQNQPSTEQETSFFEGISEIWSEPKARHFAIFVFLSMTAYFMQELILEPYAGLVFGFTPGESTSLSGAQNGGVFLGMLCVGIVCTGLNLGSLKIWIVSGCVGSAASLVGIALLGIGAPANYLSIAVVFLGFFNGMFAVAAIGSMMSLAGQGRGAREGTRMGIWGAAQAIAAGFGGLLGAVSVDLMKLVSGTEATAYGSVFLLEAAIFLVSATMAIKIMSERAISPEMVPGE
ncbi:MAG: MFS transporter [Aestuariivita sp.]|nr:MFS transporter [Aestuariivita sp.]